jgi:hypothetical protein
MTKKKIKNKHTAEHLFRMVELSGTVKERFCFISKLAAITEIVVYLECDHCRNVFAVVNEEGASMFLNSVVHPGADLAQSKQCFKHPEDPYLPGIIKFRNWDKVFPPCCSAKLYSFKPQKGEKVLPPIDMYHLCSYDEMGIPTAEEIIEGATRKVVLFCAGCRDKTCSSSGSPKTGA